MDLEGSDSMEISYIKDGNRNTMIIKDIKIEKNDYKLQMVLNNHIEGLVQISVESINNETMLYYDISSKTQMSNMFTRKQMSGKELYIFIKDIKMLSERMSEYLLTLDNIIFDTDLIFFNRQKGKYEFCYVSENKEDYQVNLRTLFDKLLEYIDHNDKEAVLIAYGIQQMTTNADFTLQELLRCAFENIQEYKKEKSNSEKIRTEDIVKLDIENKNENSKEKYSIRKKNKKEDKKENRKQNEKESEKENEKRNILKSIAGIFKRKDKYKTEEDLDFFDYLKEEEASFVAEEAGTYKAEGYGEETYKKEIHKSAGDYFDNSVKSFCTKNSQQFQEDRTMVLINPLLSKDIKLVAVGTEIPINIKPSNYPYIIGKSSSSSDFCIDSTVISRVHARITEELGDYFIEDLNSTNGTFLNGEKLEPHKLLPIEIGDKITLANIDFVVE